MTGVERREDGWVARRAGRTVGLEARPPDARLHLFGTDELGRDVAGRLVRGVLHSVGIAAASVVLAMIVAVAVGAAAALGSRWSDALLMRAVDLVLAMPRVIVFLLCATLLRPSVLVTVSVLAATGWPPLARIVRVRIQALREGAMADAARAGGCSPGRLVLRHMLPQIWPAMAIGAALLFADTVVLEAALSFLGLGAPPPSVSLGTLIASGRASFPGAWWVVVAPSAVLVLLILFVRASVSAVAPRAGTSAGVYAAWPVVAPEGGGNGAVNRIPQPKV